MPKMCEGCGLKRASYGLPAEQRRRRVVRRLRDGGGERGSELPRCTRGLRHQAGELPSFNTATHPPRGSLGYTGRNAGR